MRTLKFRAWDKTEKKMWFDNTELLYNEKLKKPYKQNFMLTMDGELRCFQWYDSGVTIHNFGFDIILMQYTGLKDKNGLTDIYEGDIIDKTGTKKGNVYESPEVYKAGFDIIIERMGTEDGGDSIKEANNRGCKYAERPGIQNSFWQLVKRTEGGRTNTKEISN